MKKQIALVSALLMILAAVTGCSQKTANADVPSETQPSASDVLPGTEEETAAQDERLDSGLSDADWGGATFTVYIQDTGGKGTSAEVFTNDFEAEELNGEPTNDAEYQRVITVQDRGNCVFRPIVVFAGTADGYKQITTSVQAGTNDYDLCCISAYASCNALVNGILMDLRQVPNLDLSKPWWDQYCIEECTFKDSVFQMTGDISIGDNKATLCYFFNKNMAADYGMPNFYDMVNNRTWTIDNFRGYAEAVDSNLDYDNDGNHTNDKDDVYGIYIWDDIMMGIVNAAGIKCCTINRDGQLELTLYSDKFVEAFDKFTAYAYNKDVTCAYQRAGYDQDWGQIAFREGRALFFLQFIGAATTFRDMADDFGILPLPLFEENQDRYYSSAASFSLGLYNIPRNSYGTDDYARVGWITEMLAYESMYTLTPAYYEQTLQNKVSRDEDSARMLDLILATRTYDFGWYFQIGGYNEGIMNLLRSYSSDVSSMYKKSEKMATKTIERNNAKIAEQINGN